MGVSVESVDGLDATVSTLRSITIDDDVVLQTYRTGASLVEQELEALDHLNRQKAIKEIAELLCIPFFDLWYFLEFGEEEGERLLNMQMNHRHNGFTPPNHLCK